MVLFERKIDADKEDDDDVDRDEAPLGKHKCNHTYKDTHHAVEYLMDSIVLCVDCFRTH